jgi:hypothetical protein
MPEPVGPADLRASGRGLRLRKLRRSTNAERRPDFASGHQIFVFAEQAHLRGPRCWTSKPAIGGQPPVLGDTASHES